MKRWMESIWLGWLHVPPTIAEWALTQKDTTGVGTELMLRAHDMLNQTQSLELLSSDL